MCAAEADLYMDAVTNQTPLKSCRPRQSLLWLDMERYAWGKHITYFPQCCHDISDKKQFKEEGHYSGPQKRHSPSMTAKAWKQEAGHVCSQEVEHE